MRRFVLTALMLLTFLLPALVRAAAGTDRVAEPGQPVEKNDAWLEGLVELLNDPARTFGWHHWFTECPNDVNYYEFVLRNAADVDRLIDKLARIKAPKIQVLLDADGCRRSHQEINPDKPPENEPAAELAIGNQKILDRWYGGLHKAEDGTRVFGVHKIAERPTALGPTLTLCVENDAVDLKKLRIPLHVEVARATSHAFRERSKDDHTIQAIDRYLAEHKARQEAARKMPSK